MGGPPGFGVMVTRLARHRDLSIGDLSQATQVSETDLRALLDGGRPSSSMLRRLGPALGLHAADVFVLAGLPVPSDLSPWDEKAGRELDEFVRRAISLPAEHRDPFREYLRSLPAPGGSRREPVLMGYEQYPPSIGAFLVQMLRTRNLDWTRSAKVLSRIGGLGRQLAASTVSNIGHGRLEVSPTLLSAFAVVLSIRVSDLAAMFLLEAPDVVGPVNPVATFVSETIWDCRRLDAGQVRTATEVAGNNLSRVTFEPG